MSSILLILALAVWGAVHSWLASLQVKGWLQARVGVAPMRFYRLLYNVFAGLSFLPVLWFMLVLPDQPFYRVPAPWSLLMLAGQVLALLLLLVSVIQTGALSFIGLGQLIRQPGPARLITSGLYRWVRHPIYSAGLLLIWLTSVVSLNTFTVFVGFSLYILIGAWFEERKLLREFGTAYADYLRTTPMLVPGLLWKR